MALKNRFVSVIAKAVCRVQQVNLLVEDKGRDAVFPEIFVVLTYGVLILPCILDDAHPLHCPNESFVV